MNWRFAALHALDLILVGGIGVRCFGAKGPRSPLAAFAPFEAANASPLFENKIMATRVA